MEDSVRKVQCPDCSCVVSYSFVLAANDGNHTCLMLVASCPRCREAGDVRSVRKYEKADHDSMVFALEHKLPTMLL